MINKTTLITDLRNIWESITPEEIRDVDVINASMDVFCEALEEFCSTSIDIKNQLTDETFQIEFYRTYNAVLFQTLEQLQTDTRFFEENTKFREQSGGVDLIDLDLINNPQKLLTEEYLIAFRNFFEKKGLKRGIEFVYNWVQQYSSEHIEELKITEVSPFVLEIEGTLSRVVYDYLVRILQHPLGFQYTYSKLVDFELDNEYYWNLDNEFIEQIDPEEFPGQYMFRGEHKRIFTKLNINALSFDGVWKSYNFLDDLDQNLNETGNPVTVTSFEIFDLPTEYRVEFEFSSGKSLVFKRVYLHNKESVEYLAQNGTVINTLGQEENVELDYHYDIIEQGTSVKDKISFTEQFEFIGDNADIVERSEQEQNLPPGFNNSGFLENIAFDADPKTKIEQELTNNEKLFKPLRFEWHGKQIGEGTPYNNTVNDWSTSEPKIYDDISSQYFDLYSLARDPQNYNKAYQPRDPNQKFFFSPLDYEPWQEFMPLINGEKPEYGIYLKEETRFKFIGQRINGVKTKVGEQNLKIDRGIRKYPGIPGFVKIPPVNSSPYYDQHLDDSRTYWQQQQGIYVPLFGEVSTKYGDKVDGEFQLHYGQNFGDSDSDRDQYLIYLDSIKQGYGEDSYTDGDVNWFEHPKARQQLQNNNLDIHTFYRALSPRQEEFNSMYFEHFESDFDPVNLQFRTTEFFDIKLI